MINKEQYAEILGLKAPWYVKSVEVDLASDEVNIYISQKPRKTFPCPICDKASKVYDYQRNKRWRHLDAWQLKTYIIADVARISCYEHGVHQIHVPWSEPRSRFTIRFESEIISWLKEANILAVSRLSRLSWDEVDGIRSRAVIRGLQRRKIVPIKKVGVDETSYRKHHDYVTVIHDQATGCVLEVLEDRRQEDLENYFKSLGEDNVKAIESVSMDMWDPYIAAVKATVDGAMEKICFDRFHIAQYFSKAVDKVRAQEHRILNKQFDESSLKGTKHQWLKNSARTDNRGRRDFMALTRSGLKTARAWAIKETAASIWKYVSMSWAEKAWKSLLSWIAKCRLPAVKKVGETIKKHLWGIMNDPVDLI
ncbi:MAG: ISL3 family transposase, partial [Candidatus Peribacteraceae bacterium]|nr:ISL3 family transposase [Candidatus Peribacteraceae bacterium]